MKNRTIGVLTAMFLLALFAIPSASADAPDDKVTICHAAGRAGTTHYVTLNIPHNAAYGRAGHFNENGTPAAGHEDDYEGACEVQDDYCYEEVAVGRYEREVDGVIENSGWVTEAPEGEGWTLVEEDTVDGDRIPCEQPDPLDPDYTEWVDGEVCNDKNYVVQTRTQISYTWVLNGYDWVIQTSETLTSTTRPLTEKEIAECSPTTTGPEATTTTTEATTTTTEATTTTGPEATTTTGPEATTTVPKLIPVMEDPTPVVTDPSFTG